MATADDVARALLRTGESLSKRLDDAPTGVTPGYNAALGGTVLPNGKIRYVREAGAFPDRLSGAIVFRTGTHQSIPNNTQTTMSWLNNYDLAFNTGGYFSAGTPTRLTAPAAGYYQLGVGIIWAANATGHRVVRFSIPGNFIDGAAVQAAPVSYTTNQSFVFPMIALALGEYIEVDVTQNSGGALNAQIGSWFSITLLASGAVAAAGGGGLGDQGSKHMTAASTTLSIVDGIDKKLDYNVADTDPWTQMSGMTFTAGVTMTVSVTASIATSGVVSWAGGDDLTLVARKNNTTDSTIDSESGPASGDWSLSGTATGISLAAGDYLEIFLIMNRGGVGSVTLNPSGAAWSINRTA